MSIVPNREQFRQLLETPHDGPVVMLNLLKFKAGGGADSYRRYGETATKMVADRGGTLLWSGRPQQVLIGDPAADGWDLVALVQYPSRRAFIEMTSSSQYQVAHKDREAGLERTVLLACEAAG